MSTPLRVSDSTRAHAAALAAQEGTSIGEVVEKALDAYETAFGFAPVNRDRVDEVLICPVALVGAQRDRLSMSLCRE